MKLTTIFLLAVTFSFAQKTETIKIPKGIVYNYCDPKVVEKAKKLITKNLSSDNDYKILQNMLIIGPELWKRFKDNEKIQQIEKGKVEFHVDNLILEGKISQDLNDAKIVWDEFKKEVSQEYTIRKANEEELKYYWSVISFDIDEPLLIVETKEHNYILNLLKKDLKLMWLDEAPRSQKGAKIATKTDPGFVTYQNGEEVDSVSIGIKETRLEKVILLNTDDILKANTSLNDLETIIQKTETIFMELFGNSTKSGKIMVSFELRKEKNEILFAVKDDLDLDIMKVFEERINNEVFPNSKKDPIQFQLILKVNSFNDSE